MATKSIFSPIVFLTLFLSMTAGPALAAVMSGPNYSIEASVLSGGGSRMTSANYVLTGTLGQPSPLGVATSANYELRPGFWESASRLAMRNMGITPAIYLLLLGE